MKTSLRFSKQRRFLCRISQIRKFCATLLISTLLLTFLPPNGVRLAHAATFSVANRINPGDALKGGSSAKAALRITFGTSTAGQNLTSIRVTLADNENSGTSWTADAATSSDLADLATDATSGITLYKDDSENGTVGTFDAQDNIVTLADSPVYATANTFIITPASTTLLADGDMYFIGVRSKSGATENHKFTIGIAAQDDIVTSGVNPTLTAGITSQPLRIDKTAPTVVSAFVENDGVTARVFFSEPLQKTTIECASIGDCANIYTVSGSIDVNSAVAMGGDALYTDAVQLNLASAGTNGTTTVTPVATVLDRAGNAFSPAATTFNQFFPPVILGVRRINGTTVAVTFDQDMDDTTTDVTARWTIETAAEDTETVTGATLQGDNRTVNVVASSATIVDGDQLIVNNIGSIQSAGGASAVGNEFFQVDGTEPTVVGSVTTDNPSGSDYIYIRFSEQMDMTATGVSGNFVPDAGSVTASQLLWYNPDTAPNFMTPDMSDKVVQLTTPDVTAISQITINASNVKDRGGNGLGGSNVASLAGAGTAITISNAGVTAESTQGSWSMFLDGCNDANGETGNTCNTNTNDNLRDKIYIPFTGSIDENAMGVDGNGLIANVGAFLEIYQSWEYDGASQADCWGNDLFDEVDKCIGKEFASLTDSYGKVIDNEASGYTANTNDIADDVLVVYLQGPVNVHDNMTVEPTGVRGTNGLVAEQNATDSKNKIPMPQFAEVQFVKVSLAGATPADGDTVTIFFNDDMNRASIGNTTDLANKAIPTLMFPWTQHTWGTGGSLAVAWGNHDGSTCTAGANDANPDCLEITLGGSPTVASGDEIMFQNGGVTSSGGVPLGFGGRIDTTAPTATATKVAGFVYVNFSEPVADNNAGDWSDNFSLDAGTITLAEAVFDNDQSAGMSMNPQKFKLTVDDTSSTAQVTFTAIIDQGGNAAPANASTSTDAVAPNIGKIIRNDWDGNGQLNAWDEIILLFDNDGNGGNGYTSDVDYTTITNMNSDFAVKRNGQVVASAFGSGANMWVDQWEEHAGELHVNLGQGANIQAGDTIWAVEGAVTDQAGNAMDHTATQYTLAAVKGGEITSIVFTNTDNSTDGGNATITDGDTFVVKFNTAIDPQTIGTYSDPTVTNLDWGLPVEHNFEANYGGEYTFVQKTWGSATGGWNEAFTELTITMAGGNAALGDYDLVQTYGVRTADGGGVQKPGVIDLSSSILETVAGDSSVAGAADTFDAGDELTFIFSEPMAEATVTTGNLGITNGNFGDEATIQSLDPEKRVFKVTLGTTNLNVVTGTTVFNPTNAVKDVNGNADATVSAVAISADLLPPPQSIATSDSDTVNTGIDGRDFTATWTEAQGAENYKIYLLPEFVRFDPSAHNPVASPSSLSCTDGSCSYTATGNVLTDSRSLDADMVIDPAKPFFALNDFDRYNVFIIATAGASESFPARATNALQFTNEYGSDGQAPKVEDSMPWDGAKNIPTNGGNFFIRFSERMNRTSVETSGNIVLEKKSGETWNTVSATVSYNDTDFAANVKPESALTSNSEYRVRVTTNVTDAGGTALASQFLMHFSTSATTDSTGPKVNTYFFDGTTTTTGISRNTFGVSVEFNEEMDGTTFTSTSVTLSPTVAGSTVKYDPFRRSLDYIFGGSLAQNTEYTLTLSGIYLKDRAGNTLDGNSDGTAAGTTADNYTLTFTTANTALSSTKPIINWMDSDSKSVLVGFDQPMSKTAVEKSSNWKLTQGSTVVSLQGATFFYDGFINELRVEGINITAGQEYAFTPTTSVVGMNGQDINTGSSTLTFTPWSETNRFEADTIKDFNVVGMDGTFNGDMFAKMGTGDFATDTDFKVFMPVSVWPHNQTAGKTTNYHVNFPTTQAIANGGKIVLKFPTSFDVSGASMEKDLNNFLPFFNQDINGPGGTMTAGSTFNQDGRVQVASIAANNQTKTVTLTLAVDDGTGCVLDTGSGDDETPVTTGTQNATDNSTYGEFRSTCTDTNQTSTTMAYDFLDFGLSGIKNGSASDVDWSTFPSTGGYQIEITTKNSSGQTLEGPIKTERFPIKEAGNGTISGKVSSPTGSAVSGARVFLDSPLAGHLEATTDASGNYSFNQLPVAATSNAWDGWYHIHIEAPESSDYFGMKDMDVQLTSSSTSSTGNNVSLSSAANTITFQITYDASLEGKKVMIWAGGPNGWKEKAITLADTDANAGNGYADTDSTIKVSGGMWDLGVGPYRAASGFGGGGQMEQDFLPSKPTQKNITGNTNVAITLTTASNTIKGTVTDGTAGLANVEVYAYTPSGEGFGSHATTDTSGAYTLKVTPGTYTVGAFKPGLPGIPEQTVTVSGNVTNINFSLVKSSSSISGNVTDGTNPIQYASVNAWSSTGQFASAITDSQGSYTMFIEPGTYTIDAFAPGYGSIDAATGVDVTDIVVATDASVMGKNFSPSSATYYLISGQVKNSSGTGIPDVFVNADQVSYSGSVAGNFTGAGNGSKTDSSGNYTIKLKANTAGTGASSTRYKLHAWSPDYGELKPDSATPVDISAANSSANNFTVAAKWTATVSVTGGAGLEKGAIDIEEAFLDIFSSTDDIGNHRRFKNINLTDGANSNIGTLDVSQGSGFMAMMHIPGVGEYQCTVGGAQTFPVTSNVTVTCNLGLAAENVITFAGTVKDGGGTAVANAWVNVTNTNTNKSFGTSAASNGTYSIKVPSGTYTIRADKPGYVASAEVTVSTDDAARTLTLTTADSTITGTVYKSNGSTPATQAFVWAENTTGGWAGAEVDSSGAYSLAVPDSSTGWTVFARSKEGAQGMTTTSAVAGDTGKNITLSSTLTAANHISLQPKSQNVTPSSGGVVDDSDGETGTKLSFGANVLGTDTNAGSIKIEETTAIPSTSGSQIFGSMGKSITATNSSGQPITNLNGDATVQLAYTKSEVDDFAGVSNAVEQNGLEELDDLQNAYWNPTTNNWVSLSTTKTVKIKNDSADANWTTVDFDTFFTNVTGDGDNSGNGGGTGAEYYGDYQISLTSTTDHFTIFGPLTGGDGTPPATPTGLTVSSAGNGSVVLDWSNNSEGDLLEYQVFRGNSSGFTCNDSSQINTSAVSSSAYTDSGVGANSSYTYYYKATAVDTSGNISSCTSAVTANYTYTAPVVVSSGGGGGAPIYQPARDAAMELYQVKSIALPMTESKREVRSLQPVNLSNTKGKITRPLVLENIYDQYKLEIDEGTMVTDKEGNAFKGILLAPKKPLESDIPELPAGVSYVTGVKLGAVDGTSLRFSKPFTLTIPLGTNNKLSASNFRIYFYDAVAGQFTLVGDGGRANAYRTALTVEADHMSLFVVLNTGGKSIKTLVSPGSVSVPVTPEMGEVESVSQTRSIPTILVHPVPDFADTRGHWAENYIDALRKRGVVTGKRDGIYDPSGDLTRAEFTKIALNAFQLPRASSVSEKPFNDVNIDEWYAPYIQAAKQNGIVQGYPDGSFRPNDPISRVEALKVILETSGLDIENTQANFIDTLTGAWYEKYVSYAFQNGFISGIGNGEFGPGHPILRSEMAQVVAKLWEKMLQE